MRVGVNWELPAPEARALPTVLHLCAYHPT